MFLIFLTAHRDRDCVEAATGIKLTIGIGEQDDAVALALASNMTATELDVSKSAVIVTEARCLCVLTFNPSAAVKAHTVWQNVSLGD